MTTESYLYLHVCSANNLYNIISIIHTSLCQLYHYILHSAYLKLVIFYILYQNHDIVTNGGVQASGVSTQRPSLTSRTITLTVTVEGEGAIINNVKCTRLEVEEDDDEDKIGHYFTEAEKAQAEAQFKDNETDVSTSAKYLIYLFITEC